MIPQKIGLYWYSYVIFRVTYKNYLDVISKTYVLENPSGFFVGFYAYYAKMFIMCFLTTYMTDAVTNSYKRRAGLKEW